MFQKEAAYYEQNDHDKVSCQLCPHNCVLSNSKAGRCGVRENVAGKLIARNYGQIGALCLDPIEKKPLYHFHPGQQIVSVGTYGCNFDCVFCQNWQLVHGNKEKYHQFTPKELVQTVREEFADSQNIGLAFTYNEPLTWFEYILEASQLAKEEGLKVVLVTNGFINQEPFSKLLVNIDAVNIDLKSFQEDFYHKYCGGKLEPVLDNIALAQKSCHLELTTLLVTDLNDREEELEQLASWVGTISKDIPIHISRYHPSYKLTKPPTKLETITRAYEIAAKYLNYVYLGNLWEWDNNTYCPECNSILINREGFNIFSDGIKEHAGQRICKKCGLKIPVIM
ncbi:MAG: AmmeMemoRadiSam system radical SAM enzyme [Bacillota bacterium]|nr:AmmeMemoRadiSam system radical SAM enzyme [Bacillota bacterium]